MTRRFVALYRVSTDKQQRSGLGLEAQRNIVQGFVAREGGGLMAEFTETESAALADDERPQLAAAIRACRIYNAQLLVARLDRLSRDAHWLLGLQKRQIDFVCADFPEVNRLTINILAIIAQEERRAISERTKQALAARRARGLPLGNPANLSNRQAGTVAGARTNRQRALDRAKDLKPIIDELVAGGCATVRAIAAALNARRIGTPRGSQWSAGQVSRVLNRVRA